MRMALCGGVAVAAELLAVLLLLIPCAGQQESPVPKPCDFDCVHGRCDVATRTCVCWPGWLGAGCELCGAGAQCAQPAPALALILPQAAPLVPADNRTAGGDGPQFVYAYGHALPRPRDGGYSCVFGSSLATRGQWVTASMVRCPAPPDGALPAGKHAFSLVPADHDDDGNGFIPNQPEWGASYFTLFVPCAPDQCSAGGRCLGPLCACRRARSGARCELDAAASPDNATETTEMPELLDNDNGTINKAIEFRPYVVKLPPAWNGGDGDALSISVESDIESAGGGLQLDPLEGQFYWASPRGRARPYRVRILRQARNASTLLAEWSLAVEPSYIAQLDTSLERINGTSNARVVSGRVTWSGGAGVPALNASVPLTLHVAGASATTIEDIPIWTDPQQRFRHALLPYLGVADSHIAITARHPGAGSATAEASLEWTQERVEVGAYASEMRATDARGTLAHNYTLRMTPLDGDCGESWRFEVVEPRTLYTIGSGVLQESGRVAQLTFRPLVNLTTTEDVGAELALRTAFICMPGGQSRIIRQTVKGVRVPRGNNDNNAPTVELDPKRLFVDADAASEDSVVLSLDIRMPHADLLRRAALESASFAPFHLVWLSRPAPNAWRVWLALRADQRQRDADGAILIRGADNLALSIPYRIQHRNAASDTNDGNGFMFTLTLKDASGSGSNDQLADVELYTQALGPHFARSVPIDEPTQFGPLHADTWQLRVRARAFLPHATLIKINPLDNALIVQLRPKPAQYFALDDADDFVAGWDDSHDASLTPMVTLSPAVLARPGDAEKRHFVDVIYAQGPAQSFVTLAEGRQDLELPMRNSTLCLGCGFRMPVRAPEVHAHSDCVAFVLPVRFVAALPIGELQFRQHFLLPATKTVPDPEATPRICLPEDGEEDAVPQLGLRTTVRRACALHALRRCRTLAADATTTPRCGAWWSRVPDALLSVHTLAPLLLMAADCGDMQRVRALVACVQRVDVQCPLHPEEAEMAPHLGGQLFNQIGNLKPFRAGLHALFPALSLVDSQLASFPTLLDDFLEQLHTLFLPDAVGPLVSFDATYDAFLDALADARVGGQIESRGNLSSLGDLARRWNRVAALLSGDGAPDALDSPDFAQVRELVARADRVKAAARQHGATDPFALFRDVVQRRVFAGAAFRADATNVTAEGDRQEQAVAYADVRVEPEEAIEGEECRILVNVRAARDVAALASVRVHVRFAQPTGQVKFRLGPIHTVGQADVLRAGEAFRAEWTVLPVPEFRLSAPVVEKPDIVLAFELDGERRAQRLRAPALRVRPRDALRLLLFAWPSVHPTLPQRTPFALLVAAINSGYSELRAVQLRELRAALRDSGSDAEPVDFRITGARVEGMPDSGDGNLLAFGAAIPSGAAAHMALNISVQSGNTARTNTLALWRNLSALVSVNGALLPRAQLDQRFLLIQQATRDNALLIVSEYASPQPLYLYTKWARTPTLTPLATVQMVEEKESRPLLNGHRFVSRVYALRRLGLFPAPSADDSAASAPVGAVFATLRVDTAATFGADAATNKLLRVSELAGGPDGRQRELDRALVWIGADSDEKTTTIHFVDLHASAAVPQLVYELLFGNPDHFRAPYFPAPDYQLQIPIWSVGWVPPREVLRRVNAISPQNSPLRYRLVSPQERVPLSVVPTTGDLVITPDPEERETNGVYCLNLVATDAEGRQARVPVRVATGYSDVREPQEEACTLFPAEQKVYEHEFKLVERQQKPTERVIETSTLKVPEGETEEEAEEERTTATTRRSTTWHHPQSWWSTVSQVHGDATLASTTRDARGGNEVTLATSDAETVTEATTEERAATEATTRAAATAHRQQFLQTAHAPQRIAAPITPRAPFAGGALHGSIGGNAPGAPRTVTSLRAGKNGTSAASVGAAEDAQGAQANAQAMAEMACRLRSTKPIWALICDMAKTVYRTTILNV